jgi:hypothetical protein
MPTSLRRAVPDLTLFSLLGLVLSASREAVLRTVLVPVADQSYSAFHRSRFSWTPVTRSATVAAASCCLAGMAWE